MSSVEYPLTNMPSSADCPPLEVRGDGGDEMVRKRLVCIDVLRGITMAVMVFVDMVAYVTDTGPLASTKLLSQYIRIYQNVRIVGSKQFRKNIFSIWSF